jgi:hypothetical protein
VKNQRLKCKENIDLHLLCVTEQQNQGPLETCNSGSAADRAIEL